MTKETEDELFARLAAEFRAHDEPEFKSGPRATRAEQVVDNYNEKHYNSWIGQGGGRIPVREKTSLRDARPGKRFVSPIGGKATVLSVQEQTLIDQPLVIYKVVRKIIKGQSIKPTI